MAIEITAVLDLSTIGKVIERKSSKAVGRAAEAMGTLMEEMITEMIDSELGPSSGRSRPGMIPMRSITWRHRVDNPGQLPITATLYSDDLDGPTGAKFGALNFGHGEYIQTGLFSMRSGEKANREDTHPVKMIMQPARAGKNWLQRVAQSAGAAFRARRFLA